MHLHSDLLPVWQRRKRRNRVRDEVKNDVNVDEEKTHVFPRISLLAAAHGASAVLRRFSVTL